MAFYVYMEKSKKHDKHQNYERVLRHESTKDFAEFLLKHDGTVPFKKENSILIPKQFFRFTDFFHETIDNLAVFRALRKKLIHDRA